MDIIKEIWEDYKKIIIIILGAIIAIILGVIIFSIVYNPINISFTGDDSGIIATMSNEIRLGAKATDKKGNEFDIQWQVSAGSLNSSKGAEIIWELPKEEGTYTISAKAGNKLKNKNITVLKNKLGELTLKNNDSIEYIDSDNDGLSDDYEKNVSNTDVNNKDSDNDILNDGDEITLDLNPNSKESKEDGKQDDERSLEYNIKNDDIGININVKGNDNIASTIVNLYDLNTVKELSGVASQVYSITTQGTLNSATINIKYDKNTISQKGIDEKSLSIYKLDVENNKYTKQKSTVDSANSCVSTTVTELGKYFLADSSKLKDKVSTELMFVIDNSGSMYSKEMVDGSQENDVQFKRVDLSNRIIDKLKGDYKFGAGKFTFEYENLISLTSDKEKVKEKINSIKTLTERFTGTYIGNALENGLKEFKDSNSNDTRKYLILLTDGKDTTNVEGYDDKKIESAMNQAKQKGIKVFTIGLGDEIDGNVLGNISNYTGGKYYYASDSSVLEDIFELIAADINYSLVDFDKDSKDDYFIFRNNDFLAKKNGMPFENFSTTQNNYGATYGMSLFSALYYENRIPSKMSSISVVDKNTNETKKALEYDLHISKNTNDVLLHNFELKNLEFMRDVPKDFMASSVYNGVLQISSEYKKNLDTYGFKYYNLDYNKGKSGFSKYENIIFDNTIPSEDDKNSNKKNNKLDNSDYNFINAIYRLDILKYRDERISFEKEPDRAFQYLLDTMPKYEVPLLVLNDDYTVALQKILVDINDNNHLKFEVYDSNYGGEQQYIDVTRSQIFNGVKENNKNKYQYRFTYNDKKVSVSVSIPNIDVNL